MLRFVNSDFLDFLTKITSFFHFFFAIFALEVQKVINQIKYISMKISKKREIINLIKKNLEICNGKVTYRNKTMYNFIFDKDGNVSMLPSSFETPKDCICVKNWHRWTSQNIANDTSNYILGKVAEVVLTAHHLMLNDKMRHD